MSLETNRQRLLAPSRAERAQALDALLTAERAGEQTPSTPQELLNLHCHTSYSYNGYGHSPTSLAWLAHEQGWYAVGSVDFDVLDGVDETLAACERAGVRGCAGLETRVYDASAPTIEFNSPGEPGVLYYCGVGFSSSTPPEAARATLDDMRGRADERNREMVRRINTYLAPVQVDYAHDVLPLTPAGNATERHILVAYDAAARRALPVRSDLVVFWANKLGMPATQVEAFLGETPFPHDAIRNKLMKRGGVGYAQPDAGTFPALDVVNRTILACGAVPSYAFLDGSSAGEQELGVLLERLTSQGMGALTVIPDRNWNIANEAERSAKVARFHAALQLARALDLPVIAGTEMNKHGQRLVDDFAAEPMRPFWGAFLDGANWAYGHTTMQRRHGLGAVSRWAGEMLPARSERNAFYIEIGRLVAPGSGVLRRLPASAIESGPRAVLEWLRRA